MGAVHIYVLMGAVHIYVERKQPLTRYVDDVTSKRFVCKHNPRSQWYCESCGKRRWAKNLSVQVYYDCMVISCSEPKVYRRASRFPFEYGHFCPV